jgi:hypothetical protein
MTTEKDETAEQVSKDEAAGFDAGFTDAPIPEAPKPTEAPVEAPAATTAPTPAPQPAAEEPELRALVRNLHGHVGALKDEIAQLKKTKEEAGKPATLTPVELKRMKAEFPEMSQFLQEDMAEVLANIAPKGIDPKEIETLVSSQVERAKAQLREESVNDAHPNWKKDCWVDRPGGTRTAEYLAWLKTMPEADATAFENSLSPAFVNRKFSEFYDWKNKAAKAETDKQNRLKAAVTPQGVPRAGQSTVSDAEAEAKGFAEGFNS